MIIIILRLLMYSASMTTEFILLLFVIKSVQSLVNYSTHHKIILLQATATLSSK